MSLRTWLIKLLGGTITTNASATKPTRSTSATSSVEPIVSSQPTAPNMETNTLFLSSDLKKLLLVHSEKLRSYDLTTNGGLNLALRSGQPVVLTKTTQPDEIEPVGTVITDNDSLLRGSNQSISKSQKIEIDLKDNSQLTLTYNKATKTLGLIGATDIIQTLDDDNQPKKDDNPTANCELHLFPLGEQRVNLWRNNDRLIVTARS